MDPAIFGYNLESMDDLTFDTRDSAAFVPKCIVVDSNFDFAGERGRRSIPWEKTIFYEAHIKGFTMLRQDIAEDLRGTYAGFAQQPVIDYIKSLGVTSIELLPIQSFINESNLVDEGLVDYWGYNTLGFFAPAPRYAANRQNSLREFKEMVARYHEAGLEIIMDVVYNHTAEGNERGPTLSYKGIDNASYYRLVPDQPRYYADETCTGNTVNVSHPRVLRMVMDSLRYWAKSTCVDGFRFDLATILAREPNGFDNQSGFMKACSQDPLLAKVKLIAEPWDCGPGGYQVGAFPPGWAEWNDKFMHTVRDFWRGQASASSLAESLCASADIFNNSGRKPWSSINLIAAHDGFTTNDVVTYNDHHNEANGKGNKNSTVENRSWNCGVEGPTEDPVINRLRSRQVRNLLATMLLSQGTPFLVAGDEFRRTQQGNNNAFCQDSDISWLNWDLQDEGKRLVSFVQKLTDLRERFPILRRRRFLSGTFDEDLKVKDVRWMNTNGQELEEKHWNDTFTKCFGMLMDGTTPETGIRRLAHDTTLLLVVNSYCDVVEFILPTSIRGREWTLLVDTNYEESDPSGTFPTGHSYGVTGRSLLLFALEADNVQ